MENKSNKYQCSSKEHSEFSAISFCQKCEIYMCTKCDSIHSNLCPNHSIYSLNNINSEFSTDIFTGFCPIEKHHQIELDYFCKTHNELCCAACIAKIKDKENGQHRDCEVYTLQKIKEEKKAELNKNIIFLENLKRQYNNKYEELKDIYQDILNEKEELKLYIQKIFEVIKNNLIQREKQLLLDIDNKFNELFKGEEYLKQSEKLPEKISSYLTKGYDINKKWNNTDIKLSILINECINIEKNLEEINVINNSLKNLDINFSTKIIFVPEKDELNNFIEKIKNFGNIIQTKNYINYSFKPYPLNVTINEKRKYKLSEGENNTKNILTKTGPDGWMGTICENILENQKIYRWKIKIIKTENKNIMVGIAPIDFDINISDYNNCGYYYYLKNSTLYSGPPYSYYGEKSNISNINNEQNEIIIVANLKKRSLKFIINGEDQGESYKDLPQDKPLTPAVILFNQNDTIEICPF